MLRLAADENFNADIVRGLLRRLPDLGIVRVQDAGLSGADDPAVLEWAAREGRIVLTQDISTLVSCAFERVAAGRPMPGVFAACSRGPIGLMIDDLPLLAECSDLKGLLAQGDSDSVERIVSELHLSEMQHRVVGGQRPARCWSLEPTDPGTARPGETFQCSHARV